MEVEVKNIRKAYDAVTVLEDVSFSLGKGQKAGLVGCNGTGKTTLLKILAGIIEPDRGEVRAREGLIIGYMPQDMGVVSDETIRDYLRRVSGIGALKERLEQSPEAVAEYGRRDGYAFDHRADVMLAGFGVGVRKRRTFGMEEASSDRRISSLSSGQKSKVFMAGVLLSDPDVLLLDEPTNNLDLPALIWLEDFLMRSKAACIIVSHDRLFLDRLVRKIFEIDRRTRTLEVTSGRYSDYLARKEKERARQRAEYKTQREEIERLTERARDKKANAVRGSRFVGSDNDKYLRGFKRDRASKSGKAAKAMEKRIEQMEVVEKPIERDVFRIRLRPAKPKGSRDIVLKDAVAGYADGGFRVGPVTIAIPYGSRVAILGLNGSGKSTLLKIISGELLPLEGEVAVGNALVIGNLTQEHDNLPREESVKDFLIRRTGMTVQDAYSLCATFGFKAVETDRKIAALSPGARARILFALFSALSANVLLLDEPTNHLDLEALEALEEAVARYKGTIVLVSHDRYFLKKFNAADTYVLSHQKIARQKSFEAYAANAEREAERLIGLL
jgi:ATPase subunit of ABC transporter with duplicated ATPase domains